LVKLLAFLVSMWRVEDVLADDVLGVQADLSLTFFQLTHNFLDIVRMCSLVVDEENLSLLE